MSDLARLATSIERASDASLLTQIQKYVEPNSAPGNQFALANLLLGKRSLEARIRSLSKTELAELLATKTSAALRAVMLADELSAFDAAVNLAAELAAKSDASSAAIAPLDFEVSVFDAVRCLTEICYATERHWLKVSSRGLKASDAKQLAERLRLPEVVVHSCSQLLVNQELLAADSQGWVVTKRGTSWLKLNFADRWFQIANEALSSSVLRGKILNLKAGDDLAAKLSDEFPLLKSGVSSLVQAAIALGLLSAGKANQLFVQLQTADTESSRVLKLLEGTFPAEQPKVIVQSDLTILVTGPLTSSLWDQLDAIAESLELGMASKFRINLASVTRALQAGWKTKSIGTLLAELSGREVPQPVSFLLRDAERRFGELEVMAEPRGCSIRSRDAILIAQIKNESNLGPFKLRSTDARTLESPLGAREVGLGLRAAGYPALLPARPLQQSTHPDVGVSNWANEWLQAIRAGTESEESTRAQLLQFALRDAIPLSIRYRGPTGEATVSVRVLGVTPQRIRCREIGREAELTLPQSSIQEISIGLG